MKKLMVLAAMVAMTGTAETAEAASVECPDLNPADYWNAEELFTAPKWRANPYPDSEYPGLKAMLVSGKGPSDTSAEFFAYYAKPAGPVPKGGFPGLLLVHGGGGTAYPQYTEMFVKDGFAVLAIDWYNRRPAPGLTNAPPTETSVPRVPMDGGYRQDHVANVANMVLAHSLLRSFPEVNPGRTVYVGLSWGSWYGSCVTAVDGRFKGACMIYLCDRHPCAAVTPKDNVFVKGPFHKSMKVPSWWIVWPRDSNGLPSTMQAGWEACPTDAGRSILHDLGHSHSGFTVDLVHRMARSFVGLDRRLPFLSLGERKGRKVSAKVLDRGQGLAEALLWYTTCAPLEMRDVRKNSKTEWKSVPAKISGGKVVGELPADARIAYLSAYEAGGVAKRKCASSGFFHVEAEASPRQNAK